MFHTWITSKMGLECELNIYYLLFVQKENTDAFGENNKLTTCLESNDFKINEFKSLVNFPKFILNFSYLILTGAKYSF